ncbi:MAG TPA: hypothetical protein PKD79_01245 [Candidatus Doudnabacteria bacterium]|nr:hypothetical protein [Candidatus Doudnabacteria bacterium]
MTPERQQELFEDKYASKLGVSYSEWLETAPETEDQAYAKLAEIDVELKQISEDITATNHSEREILEDERDRLKLEYDLIEEMFGLELDD